MVSNVFQMFLPDKWWKQHETTTLNQNCMVLCTIFYLYLEGFKHQERRLLQSMGWNPDEHDDDEGGLEAIAAERLQRCQGVKHG